MRLEKDGEAHVPLRHGQVVKRAFNKRFEQRLRVRQLCFLVLRGL
jgi:hypothetical protein